MVPYCCQLGAADEREQNADAPVGGRVVEDGSRRAVVADAGAAQPVLAPERLVVDGVALHQLAHGHLGEQGLVR